MNVDALQALSAIAASMPHQDVAAGAPPPLPAKLPASSLPPRKRRWRAEEIKDYDHNMLGSNNRKSQDTTSLAQRNSSSMSLEDEGRLLQQELERRRRASFTTGLGHATPAAVHPYATSANASAAVSTPLQVSGGHVVPHQQAFNKLAYDRPSIDPAMAYASANAAVSRSPHQVSQLALNPRIDPALQSVYDSSRGSMFANPATACPTVAPSPAVDLFAQTRANQAARDQAQVQLARAQAQVQAEVDARLIARQQYQQQRLLREEMIFRDLMLNNQRQQQQAQQQQAMAAQQEVQAAGALQQVLPNGLTVGDMLAVLEYSKAKESSEAAANQSGKGADAREGSAADDQQIPQDQQRPGPVADAASIATANSQAAVDNQASSITASVPLASPNDSAFLSEAHCFLRSTCLELFVATSSHVRTPGKGARPARLGQAGLRCVHCRDVPRSRQANQAICYPSGRDKVYESVRNFRRVHLPSCPHTPGPVREQFDAIVRRGAGPRRSQKLVRAYYAQAAAEVGLVDSERNGGGLEYRSENSRVIDGGLGMSEGMKDILRAARVEEEQGNGDCVKAPQLPPIIVANATPKSSKDEDVKYGKFHRVASDDTRKVLQLCQETSTPFVAPQDFDNISDYVYVLFHQLLPCKHTPATMKRRRLDPRLAQKVPGLCCKHCAKVDGINGMYFPLSVDSLGDSSFSQTLMMHLTSCPHAPKEVKVALEELKALAREYNSSVKRGAKKVFIERVWGRMIEIAQRDQQSEK